MIWDDCHKCWFVEVRPGAVVQTTGALENTPKAIFYHPWQTPQRYTDEEVKTQPLPGRVRPQSPGPSQGNPGHCTCGGKFAGGTHSDWCDINHKEEDEIPF